MSNLLAQAQAMQNQLMEAQADLESRGDRGLGRRWAGDGAGVRHG